MAKLTMQDLPRDLDEMLDQLETGNVDFEDLPDEAQEFLSILVLFSILDSLDTPDNSGNSAV